MDSHTPALTHRTTYRVIYGDTDTMGVVYHANYLRWFEMGRNELFRHLGLPYKKIEAQGIMLPVSEVTCKYIHPARYDDLLVIETSVNTGFRAGIAFDYTITNEDGTVVHTIGTTRHAFINDQGKVIRPPAIIRELIRKVSRSAEETKSHAL